MIKSVIFDLGKVLVDFDYGIAARKVAACSSINTERLDLFLSSSPVLLRYETGLLSTRQFYEEIRTATGFEGELEEFGSFFADIFWEIEPMVQLQAELRRRGLTTYVFSNTNDLAISHIRRKFPFYANFDGHILSYEHGAMKPDAKLYEVVEQMSGHKGPELLYLDDRPENIAAGAARGWQVILQESPEKTRAAIEKLGLLNHI